MHDGYIQVNNTTQSKIFYILYAAGGQNNSQATVNNSAPLILWLQGGPGCSDGAGLYLEIGPFTVKNISGKLTPVQQPVTWNDEYNLLFVDSPVGVGFSVCGDENPSNAWATAEYLQIFLIRFFQVYTSLANNPFYIFGESFGGHYIPALASIITQNVTNNKINLQGIGIGDGWTDPYIQVASFSDYCYTAGLLDENQRDKIAGLESQAQAESAKGNPSGLTNIFDFITGNITELNNEVDIYNWQIYDLPSECKSFSIALLYSPI
jgi:vitellogenic carboxypeptidase-like protein